MKFINLGDRHSQYDFLEDSAPCPQDGKPRYIPSYFDTSKKKQSGNSKKTKGV